MLAYVLIIISVLSYAVFPLVIASMPSGQVPAPVFLVSLSLIGVFLLVPTALVLLASVKGAGKDIDVRHAFRLALRGDALALGAINATLNNIGYGFLFLAIQSGLVLTGAVLYELWSTVFMLASWKLRKDKQGAFVARQGGPTTVIFFSIGIIGLIIVAYAGAVAEGAQGDTIDSRHWLGLTMAILSPVAMGLSFVFGTENGQRIARRLQRETDMKEEQSRIVGGVVSSMLLRLFTIVIQALLLGALLLSGTISVPDAETFGSLLPLILLAGLIVAVGGSFSTIGNTLSNKANLNLLYYFVPFLTLIALYSFGFITELGPLAYFGCILVLAANYVLTATYGHSLAFRFSIGTVCIASALVLYTKGIGTPLKVELVAVLLGLFGIVAAFLIDRIVRDGERLFGPEKTRQSNLVIRKKGLSRRPLGMTTRRSRALESYGQNIFVLWTLAFGSLTLLFVFRSGKDVMYDFFAVVTSVAIIYMALVPVDLMERFSPLWRTRQADWEDIEYEQLVLSLLVSVLFLFALLSLLLLAVQVR